MGWTRVSLVYTYSTLSKAELLRVRRLDLTAPTRNMGPRRLLHEGALLKSKSGRKLRGFLCSDILVLTDEHAKALYRMVSRWDLSYDLQTLTRS